MEPGRVSPALIQKLIQQLMTPRQIDKLERTRHEIDQRQYTLKCLNSAIQKHIARRPGAIIQDPSIS